MELVQTEPTLTLPEIASAIKACAACTARKDAMQPVPGVGHRTGIVVIGRNPGEKEDKWGAPFVGPAGKVLDTFLAAVGLTRNDVFITNLVNCYTTDDRPPTGEEVTTCWKLHTRRYIQTLAPYLVITFGSETAKALCGIKKITQQHGEMVWHRMGFWVIPCIHPAAQLYDPKMKHAFAYDAIQVKRFLIHKEELIAKRAEKIAAQEAEVISA